MSALGPASYILLVLTAALLLYIAATDLREFKIRNELVISLAVLCFAYAAMSGRWVSIHWNIGFALLMFALMLFAYSQRLMGGGDLKLLTVAFLWTGPWCALPFAIFLLIFAAAHTLAGKYGWLNVQEVEGGKKRIPFGPSIAGALIVVFVIGCLGRKH
jgi:prepilin peptidase CpaA